MEFRHFQSSAAETDQVPLPDANAIIVPLLGLVGEAGVLLSEYKKFLRDGEAHRLLSERVAEELGDILWYVANVATKFDLDLDIIAGRNIAKTRDRWALRRGAAGTANRFDAEAPADQQFPRRFEVAFVEQASDGKVFAKVSVDSEQLGARLTDNSYTDDGYRYHDVFHLSYATVLGWSPVIRKISGVWKRRYLPQVDDVEDGGRAQVVEEAIAALVFAYASNHRFLEEVSTIDFGLLQTIRLLTRGFEAERCTLGEWERAILLGFDVWRQLVANHGGRVAVDLDARTMTYISA
jgi:NTP pyrophosphatase (non-canonical NTP hydrolase)